MIPIQTAYQEILNKAIEKLNGTASKNNIYLSWWLRIDLNQKYSTQKINYELRKAVKLGLLTSKTHRYGVEYSLPLIKN